MLYLIIWLTCGIMCVIFSILEDIIIEKEIVIKMNDLLLYLFLFLFGVISLIFTFYYWYHSYEIGKKIIFHYKRNINK